MDKFYNELPVDSANFTGSSKGYKANNVFGDIAQGVGDVVKMATTAADDYFKGTIKEEAQTASKNLFAQYGNDAAVAQNSGTVVQQTPQAIQQGADQLKMLQTAVQNGTLKDSSYWAQAELISRQLKSRYPGYWEDVDKSMAEATGHNPAQKLHAELMQEYGSGGSKQAQLEKDAYDAARSAGLPQVFSAKQAGKPYALDEINRMVADKNAVKWDQESQNRSYENKKNMNSATEEDALKAAGTEAQNNFVSLMNATGGTFYKNVTEFRQLQDKAEMNRKNGQPVDSTTQARLTSLSQTIDNAVNDIQNQVLLKYGSDAPTPKIRDRIGFLSDWAKNTTSLIASGEKNLSSYNVALLKGQESADTFNLLNSNDAIRSAHALTLALGPQAEIAFEGRQMQSPAIVDRDLAVMKAMSNNQFLSGVSLDSTTQTMAKNGISDPKTYDAKVTRAMNGITDKDIPVNIKSNLINSLYGVDNQDFLTNSVPQKQRIPMFQRLTAPVMTKSIQEMYDNGQIGKDVVDKHTGWATKNAIELIHDQAAEVNSISTSRKSISMFYNYDTNRLEAKANPNYTVSPDVSTGAGKFVSRLGEIGQGVPAKEAVDQVNNILARMDNILKVTGADPKKEIPEILKQAGIEVGTGALDKKELGNTGLEPAVIHVEKDASTIAKSYTRENLMKALELQAQSGEYGNAQ